MRVTAFAAAKVNLYLHVTGRRADGYHLLDSLVAFPEIGDCITAELAPGFSLEISGPEAAGLVEDARENLVLRAARLLAERIGTSAGARLRLEKNLPVAGGIGGGSSDAAAALRALAALWGAPISREALWELGLKLGADVPACLYRGPVWVGGIGERIEPAPLPAAGILLANPRRALPTAAVFAARSGEFGDVGRFERMPEDAAGLAQALSSRRNDLTSAAVGFVPEIGTVLTRLARLPGALLTRMSGSGPTCFALFRDRAEADEARAVLGVSEPEWWCAAGALVAPLRTIVSPD
ncbi:MAG: 4-(cytidine 5'-diphospho)-2-C-methyl-D-erythritol kinase [Alphaproteobacteria bacterium]|nr:4-(cytidine 5'-diphospho)-2-C-methyl-D-erythritol kinase [Alphaproteobacteria bacterium]